MKKMRLLAAAAVTLLPLQALALVGHFDGHHAANADNSGPCVDIVMPVTGAYVSVCNPY